MQKIDSESPVPASSSDRKTLSKMLTNELAYTIEDTDVEDCTAIEFPPDQPPESFWLSKESEFDWFDRNAFLDRKESTKGNVNSTNPNPSVTSSHSNPSSQRYSVTSKSKAAIIGLPKPQKTSYVDLKCRKCKKLNVRMFPKSAPVTEPSSPKVSCIGPVRSKRCPIRRMSSVQSTEPVQAKQSGSKKPGLNLISRILSFFCCKRQCRRRDGESASEKVKKPAESFGSRRICVSVKPVDSEPGTPSEPPALGGVMRFASGRRSDYWGGSGGDDVAERCSGIGATR